MDNQVKTQARMSIWPKWLRPERPAKPLGGTHVAPVARSIGSGKYVSSQGWTHGDPPANKKATMRTSSLSSLAEQVSSRPTHASEMRLCKTWQIPQHKTEVIKKCKTNIVSPGRLLVKQHISHHIGNNGKPKQHIFNLHRAWNVSKIHLSLDTSTLSTFRCCTCRQW